MIQTTYDREIECMKGFKRKLIRCLGVFCLGFGLAVSASDVEKEGRWAEEVVDQLFDGEPVWLLTDSVRFLGLHVVPESEQGGGLLILHGRGVHPDWPQVVNPLRVALAEAGWHTLSLQLPVLANGVPGTDYKALLPEVRPRIEAGLKFLERNTTGPWFVVAHSMGSTMAVHALTQIPPLPVKGLVLIGLGSGQGGRGLDPDGTVFSRLSLPVLDLFGEQDLEGVIRGAGTRAKLDHGFDYTQVKLDGADHFFDGYETELIAVVSGWLNQKLAE